MSAWFVEDFLETFRDKTVLELGAGPGLCGFVAAHVAKTVVLTDYQDLVMDLIDKNISTCNPNPDNCQLFAARLDWDKMIIPEFYESLEYTNSDQQVEGKFCDIDFDYVIGSDVVYWPQSIIPLCNVLDALFKRKPSLVFYICYIERIKQVHVTLLEKLKEFGFTVEEIA